MLKADARHEQELSLLETDNAKQGSDMVDLETRMIFFTTYFQAWTSYKSHIYTLSRKTANIDDAQNLCVKQRGYLVEINDRAEFDFVLLEFVRKHTTVKVFVGSKYTSGRWRYIASDTVMDIPAIGDVCGSFSGCDGSGEYCLVFDNLNFEDVSCTISYYFVCEI